MSAKLSPAQAYWLREIAAPSDNSADFPPLPTLRVLIRKRLVEPYEDPEDTLASILGLLSLRVTDEGLRVLGGLQ